MWTGLAGVLLLFLDAHDGDNILPECCVPNQLHVLGLYSFCYIPGSWSMLACPLSSHSIAACLHFAAPDCGKSGLWM